MSLFLLTGCTNYVTPPRYPQEPVRIFLTDYGRHSSILLPDSHGGYTEWAFGDWNFFALGHTQWYVATRALIDSPQASLGTRHFKSADPTAQLKAKRVMSIMVSRVRVETLDFELASRFKHDAEVPYASKYSELDQVPDAEHYWIFNNCNTVTADWLRRLGCKVCGPALWSNFKVVESSE